MNRGGISVAKKGAPGDFAAKEGHPVNSRPIKGYLYGNLKPFEIGI